MALLALVIEISTKLLWRPGGNCRKLVFRGFQESRGAIELRSRRQPTPVGGSIPDGSQRTLPGVGAKKLRAFPAWEDDQHEQSWRPVYYGPVPESWRISGALHQLAGAAR